MSMLRASNESLSYMLSYDKSPSKSLSIDNLHHLRDGKPQLATAGHRPLVTLLSTKFCWGPASPRGTADGVHNYVLTSCPPSGTPVALLSFHLYASLLSFLTVHRWASVGAFYPFSRNHYGYNSRPHEYYRWPDVTAAAKKAFTLRYQLLTYLYSSLYLAHAHGGTVARPLFFTDPSDLLARWAGTKAGWDMDGLRRGPLYGQGRVMAKGESVLGRWKAIPASSSRAWPTATQHTCGAVFATQGSATLLPLTVTHTLCPPCYTYSHMLCPFALTPTGMPPSSGY